MTNLREKMKQEMLLIGLARSTQKRYLDEVVKLHAFYQKSPAKLSNEEIHTYLLHLKKRLSPQTLTIQLFMPSAFFIALH